MPLLSKAKREYRYTVDFDTQPTFVTDSWDTAMKEASKGIDKDERQWIDVIDNENGEVKWRYRGYNKQQNSGRRKNPSIEKTVSRVGRSAKTMVKGITGKIVQIGKDSITVFAPKGTSAQLMSNPGIKSKIKYVQIGVS